MNTSRASGHQWQFVGDIRTPLPVRLALLQLQRIHLLVHQRHFAVGELRLRLAGHLRADDRLVHQVERVNQI